MTRSAKRILSIGCVILLLSGTVSSCKKRNTGSSQDASAVAEQQIRNTLDDFFAYIKVAKTDKISARSDDPAPLEEYLREVTETSGTKPFETSCRRVDAEVVSVTSSGEEGSAEVEVSYADPQTIKEKAALAGGFADIGKLSESISTAPVVTKEFKLDMHHVDGSWKITSRSTREILEVLFGYLTETDLIAEIPETTTEPVTMNISVFDAYWVNEKGEEIGGYYCSEKNICLYVYTWNTYTNVDIKYEYLDASGSILYTNSFFMKNNTDWIACAWKPEKALPEGDIYCRLYEPSGEEFHTSKVTIFNEGDMIPFPITWTEDSGWLDKDGNPVEYYTEDTTLFAYRGSSLKPYQGLSLKYRFVDDEGQVLYEGKMDLEQETETFMFSMELPEGYTLYPEESAETTKETSGKTSATSATEETTAPTELPEPKHITLIVETEDGKPFLQSTVEIRQADAIYAPDETAPGTPDGTAPGTPGETTLGTPGET
jgi:hypothetical protein